MRDHHTECLLPLNSGSSKTSRISVPRVAAELSIDEYSPSRGHACRYSRRTERRRQYGDARTFSLHSPFVLRIGSPLRKFPIHSEMPRPNGRTE